MPLGLSISLNLYWEDVTDVMDFDRASLLDYPIYKLQGKRVFVRADLNDPADSEGNLTGDMRLRAVAPTLAYLCAAKAKVILASHFGRPKNKESNFSLKGVRKKLSGMLNFNINFIAECAGRELEDFVSNDLKNGEILLIENLRFCPGETKNDMQYARYLASLSDMFVQEAFGACHREHASMVSVPKLLPSFAGFLLEKEVTALSKLTKSPERPFLLILGGKKVSDKIKLINNLIEKVDAICIGGGMAFAFLKASGYDVGKSYVEEAIDDVARQILYKAGELGKKIILPVDIMVAKDILSGSECKLVDAFRIPSDWYGVDIGPNTLELFKEEIFKAKTILWNGPMGVFEIPEFSWGSRALALAVAISEAVSVCGGGDTSDVLRLTNMVNYFSHVSTGGGAALKFLEGEKLPGIDALPKIM